MSAVSDCSQICLRSHSIVSTLSDRANISISILPRKDRSGNRKRGKEKSFIMLCSDDSLVRADSQFQKRQGGICVKELLLALQAHVVLKGGCGLGVVAVEAVEDFLDMLWSLFTFVEGLRHRDKPMWKCAREEYWSLLCVGCAAIHTRTAQPKFRRRAFPLPRRVAGRGSAVFVSFDNRSPFLRLRNVEGRP